MWHQVPECICCSDINTTSKFKTKEDKTKTRNSKTKTTADEIYSVSQKKLPPPPTTFVNFCQMAGNF